MFTKCFAPKEKFIEYNRLKSVSKAKKNNNNNYNINLCTAIVYKGDFIYREQIDYTKC